MCRLFGFRSISQSQVHQSLVYAENALLRQSEDHPDGWGLAYYHADAPHVVKSADTAHKDSLYRAASTMVTSKTVLAHIRKATAGEPALENSHPFQYGSWVFAHNGKISDLDAIRPLLLERIAPPLRARILGKTDSECFFYLILTHLARRTHLFRQAHPLYRMAAAAQAAIAEIFELTGGETYLTFILTDGNNMLAYQGGKELHVSTHKTLCTRRAACPQFDASCEQVRVDGRVNHFILSSEPLRGENVWRPLALGEMIGVDASMNLHQLTRVKRRAAFSTC